MPQDNKDARLKCEVKDNILTISIGIYTLADSAIEENGGPVSPFTKDGKKELIIDRPKEFAQHVAYTMLQENEIGESFLTKFLDKCILESVNNDNHGVKYVKV